MVLESPVRRLNDLISFFFRSASVEGWWGLEARELLWAELGERTKENCCDDGDDSDEGTEDGDAQDGAR